MITTTRGNIVDDIPGIRRILGEYRRIAVVGLSAKWYRPSYFAAKYLKDHGYEITPVNPNYEMVLDETCYPDLPSIPGKIDVVDLFQRSDAVMPFVDQAIEIGARVVWMQLGVINERAANRALNAGLDVVMNRCMKIEHARLFGGLNLVGVTTGVISSRRPRWFPH
jgi:predicted CoA-binding protein